jgi:hypothetical protein
VFFAGREGCRVHSDRPRQCRSWPFWSSVVHSRERWREEAAGCPGMDRGPLHPAARIAAIAADDGTRGSNGGGLAGRAGSPVGSSGRRGEPA